MPDPPNPKIWGDSVAVTEEAVKNCDLAKSDTKNYMDCLGGAYHGVIDYMRDGLYKLGFDKNDLFLICKFRRNKKKRMPAIRKLSL